MSADHGNTPGAWAGVSLGLVGFVVGAVGLMLDPVNYPTFWVGVGIAAVSLVVYLVFANRVPAANEETH